MNPGLLPAGSILQDRYQIVRLLGQGGMGAVYLAHDQRLDRPCAVKETLDVSPQAQQQFAREARLLARLHHPHLPRVTDYFAQTGRYYLVMDYVEGDNLDVLVRSHGPAPPDQALTWMVQVLDALEYLHTQQPPVIHRDVKPANVKITPAGQAFLVDFGIAKEYHPGRHTVTGARALTPGYAPLEQYAARGETDARTDVYGVGATLYYLLTAIEPTDAIARAAGARLPSVCDQNPRLRALPRLDGLIGKALALQKEERWASAVHMSRALQKTGSAAQARPAAPGPRAGSHAAHNQRAASLPSGALLWGLGGAAAALLILFLVLWFVAGRSGDPGARTSPTASVQVVHIPQATVTLHLPAATPSVTRTIPPTAEPLAPATSTPTRMVTPPPTDTPIARPTATATPTIASSPQSSPRSTATRQQPTMTPAPVASYPAPTLREPFDAATLQGVVTFVWQWSQGALAANDYFDLRFWSQSELDARTAGRGAAPPTKDTRLTIDVGSLHTILEHGPNTSYYWAVVVVRQSPGTGSPQVVGEWSVKRIFYYTAPSEPGPGPEPTEPPPVAPTQNPTRTPIP
ncbi:MAG: protein kinase [Anaerolineae bacterium]|nr:protein kinase [Anaerolineae bacterium]